MPDNQLTQHQPSKVLCRFAMTAADTNSGHEFCMFELPKCKGCPYAMDFIDTVGGTEDPMMSTALMKWIAGLSRSKN